jgi:hypothetical protein
MKNHIFISYSRKDQDYTRKLADELRKRKFDVWMDDRINFGSRWWKVIEEAIIESKAVVLVMSPHSFSSKWVEKEYMLADDEKKPIFPLLLSGNRFPYFVNTQWIDVSEGKIPSQNFFEQLMQITSNVLQQSTSIQLDQVEELEQEEKARKDEKSEISQDEYIKRILEQPLPFPIVFDVETPRDGQEVREGDCPFSASGTYYSEKALDVWVILDDVYGNFYIQAPPINFLPRNRWEARNINPAPGIEHIHFIYVDKQGDTQFSTMVQKRRWGGFKKLPPNSKILQTIRIKMVTD